VKQLLVAGRSCLRANAGFGGERGVGPVRRREEKREKLSWLPMP